MNLSLNIVSFDVPYPPNYGGVIDVFYKIKSLHNLGVQIILHTFKYGKQEQNELLNYCQKVYYYPRNNQFNSFFSSTPFIVKTRANNQLISNLNSNNFPILFEGIHTSYPLLKTSFKNRITLLRLHNIEHNYYNGLSKSESNLLKKIFFKVESLKLKFYEKHLRKATYLLTISPSEQLYFSDKFPNKSSYLPVFHGNELISSTLGKGNYALYHGDLRISDNIKACNFLITIFSKTNYPLIISGNFKNTKLINPLKKYSNITFFQTKNNEELVDLIKNAHIHVLPTFQNTGIKLKLINALFNGRFCLVNEKMIENTGLKSTCEIANSKLDFIKKIQMLFEKDFKEIDVELRKKALKNFNNTISAQQIIKLIK